MKRVYIAIIDNKMIAYHRKKMVVDEYLQGYKESHPNASVIMARSIGNINGFLKNPENELVSVGNTYVPYKYEDAYYYGIGWSNLEIGEMIQSLWELRQSEPKKKRRVKFDKAIEYLQELDHPYTPSIDELQRYQDHFLEYQYRALGYEIL